MPTATETCVQALLSCLLQTVGQEGLVGGDHRPVPAFGDGLAHELNFSKEGGPPLLYDSCY